MGGGGAFARARVLAAGFVRGFAFGTAFRLLTITFNSRDRVQARQERSMLLNAEF